MRDFIATLAVMGITLLITFHELEFILYVGIIIFAGIVLYKNKKYIVDISKYLYFLLPGIVSVVYLYDNTRTWSQLITITIFIGLIIGPLLGIIFSLMTVTLYMWLMDDILPSRIKTGTSGIVLDCIYKVAIFIIPSLMMLAFVRSW